MPKGKVRKVSKKRVSKKRGKRISHKKRKVMKGGDYDPKPYEPTGTILYLVNGELKYGNIIRVEQNKTPNTENNIYTVNKSNQSRYPREEKIYLSQIIRSFDPKMNNENVDLISFFEQK